MTTYRPNGRISDEQFSWIFQDVPEQKEVERDGSSYDCSSGSSQAFDTVTEEADKTTNGEGSER